MQQQGQKAPDLTNEEETRSLPEKEFRIMIGKTIQHLGNTRENTRNVSQGTTRTEEQTNNDEEQNK